LFSALRDKAIEEGLSEAEQLERIRLEQDRDDREPRLQRLLREAVTAQGDLDIDHVLATWDELTAQKLLAYEDVKQALLALYAAWQAVFYVHHLQEEHWAKLPRAGSSLSTFPGGPELAQWLTSRMPFAWQGILTSAEQQAWRIDWEAVLDVDPGLKPLEHSAVGRIRDRPPRIA
jgi:hypothetical protein